eukprot:1560622-Amphidinium_carterae.2
MGKCCGSKLPASVNSLQQSAVMNTEEFRAVLGSLPSAGADSQLPKPAGSTASIAAATNEGEAEKRSARVPRLPSGVTWRSGAHTALMRERGRHKKELATARQESAAVSTVLDIWNESIAVRAGDQVLLPGDAAAASSTARVHRSKKKHDVSSPSGSKPILAHSSNGDGQVIQVHLQNFGAVVSQLMLRSLRNQWTVAAWERVAWEQVGGKPSQKGPVAINSTRRQHDALVSYATIVKDLYDEALGKLLSGLPHRSRHLVLCKHHDSTPWVMQFGALSGLLDPGARFTVRDSSHPRGLRTVSLDEFRKLRRVTPEKGILHLMDQAATLHWIEVDETLHVRVPCLQEVTMMPAIVERNNGSTIFAAVEDSPVALRLESIRELAPKLDYVLVCEVPDQHSGNTAKKMRTIAAYEDLPNVMYYHSNCLVHQLNLVMQNTTKELDIIGGLHAIAYVTRLVHCRTAPLKALRTIVEEDLAKMYFPHSSPPDTAHSSDTENILCHMILRDSRAIGSMGIQQPSCLIGPGTSKEHLAAQKVLQFVHGNPADDVMKHYCSNCCANREAAVENVFCALVESNI